MSTFRMDGKTSVTESSGTFTFNNAGILPSGHILGVSHHVYGARTGLYVNGTGRIWNVGTTKKYDKETSYLSLHCQMWGHENYSDQCGIYAHIEGSTTMETDGTAYHDILYTGGNSGNETFQILISGKIFENLDAGSHNVDIGWNVRNFDTGNRPFVIWNHNSSDDVRHHQARSKLTIYEIKK